MQLPRSVLFYMSEFAKEEILEKAKQPEETEQNFITRCWVNGLSRALMREEYSICISKNGKEVWFSKQS